MHNESSSPLVSIIINCFNGERYLNEAIDSIYSQTYSNWEIIFWDNASNDNSSVIAKSYDSKLKYFLAEENTKLGKARNLALREAKGDYVAFLDCDDIYLPDKIFIQCKAMMQNNSVLSYGSWIKINEKGEKLSEHKITNNFGYEFESLLSKYRVNSQTIMLDNNFLIENKINFDENLAFSTDHNLVLRIALNYPVLAINHLLAKYRVHEYSMSSNKKLDKINDFNYTINYFNKLGIDEKYKNFRFIALKAKYRLLLFDLIEEGRYLSIFALIFNYLRSLIKVFLKF